MINDVYKAARRVAQVAAMSALLTGCASIVSDLNHFFGKSPRKSPPVAASPMEGSEAFLYNLALARIALPAGTEDLSGAQPYLKPIQDYLAQKKHKAVLQTVVIMHYKDKADPAAAMQEVLVPVPMPAGPDFSDMLDIMKHLDATPYTLYDISAAQEKVVSSGVLYIKGFKPEQVRAQLDVQNKRLAGNATKLPWAADIEMQMAMLRFFMDHHYRDAAYITADNAKQLLAKASEQHADKKDGIEQISRGLDALEIELHRTMPFTMGLR